MFLPAVFWKTRLPDFQAVWHYFTGKAMDIMAGLAMLPCIKKPRRPKLQRAARP
jgi:hypothetical protein